MLPATFQVSLLSLLNVRAGCKILLCQEPNLLQKPLDIELADRLPPSNGKRRIYLNFGEPLKNGDCLVGIKESFVTNVTSYRLNLIRSSPELSPGMPGIGPANRSCCSHQP